MTTSKQCHQTCVGVQVVPIATENTTACRESPRPRTYRSIRSASVRAQGWCGFRRLVCIFGTAGVAPCFVNSRTVTWYVSLCHGILLAVVLLALLGTVTDALIGVVGWVLLKYWVWLLEAGAE